MSYDNLFWGDADTPNHSQWHIRVESLLADRDLFAPHANKVFPLGAIADARDGRRFRYIKDGGSGLSKALMCQSSVPIAGNTEVVNTNGTAAVAGDKFITIGTTTTIAKDALIDGFLLCVDVTAAILGDMYLIKSNPAGTTPKLGIADRGGIRTAIPVTAELTVIKNKFRDVIAVPAAAATAVRVGVPLVDFTADYYGWVQTRGYCPVLVDANTLVVGNPAGETTTAGVAGGVGVVAGDGTDPVWGIVVVKSTNGQTDQPAIIDLTLE